MSTVSVSNSQYFAITVAFIRSKLKCLSNYVRRLIWTCRRSIRVRSWCDMSFYIKTEDITISAHKNVVGCSSKVLNRFVYGSDHFRPTNPITVDYCGLAEFLKVLDFIYDKKVNITGSDLAAIMDVAHYFDLSELEDLCSKLVIKTITIENVCETFDIYWPYKNDVYRACLRMIQVQTYRFFINETILNLSNDALHLLLDEDILGLTTGSETWIFNLLKKWAQDKCNEKQLECTPENLTMVLGRRTEFLRQSKIMLTHFLSLYGKPDDDIILSAFLRNNDEQWKSRIYKSVICHDYYVSSSQNIYENNAVKWCVMSRGDANLLHGFYFNDNSAYDARVYYVPLVDNLAGSVSYTKTTNLVKSFFYRQPNCYYTLLYFDQPVKLEKEEENIFKIVFIKLDSSNVQDRNKRNEGMNSTCVRTFYSNASEKIDLK